MTIKVIAILIALAPVGIGLLLLGLWIDHTRETALPALTGSFAVGRRLEVWRDAATPAGAAASPMGTGQREMVAWIWYPAAARQPVPAAEEYLPPDWRVAVERHRGGLNTELLTRDLARVRVHSVREPQVSPEQRSYPVVLMRPGLSALTAEYTSLAEDLASHGYVVVGFDVPYRTNVVVFPDGRVMVRSAEHNADAVGGRQRDDMAHQLVAAWTADMGFVLDRLEQPNAADAAGTLVGRLDLQRVGAFGHSLGGASALQFCHDDARCKAGIDVDGAPYGSVIADGVSQPFMFLLSDHRDEANAPTNPIAANVRAIFDRLPRDRRVRITIRGANHFMFSDDAAMLKSPILIGVLRLVGIVRIDGRRQVMVASRCISRFFDVYLKGAPLSSIKSLPGYPEVVYEE